MPQKKQTPGNPRRAKKPRPAKATEQAKRKPSAKKSKAAPKAGSKAEKKERASRAPTAFVASGERHDQLPEHGLPEIAFIGRSNVGKSSALGALLKKPDMVRTSKTPGRTQLLNLFRFERKIAFVDLPGYGFAKLSKRQREKLSVMVRDYLAEREGLRGVVVLLDARRDGPSPEDYKVVEWILEHERPILIVLTKIDLVPKNKRLNHVTRYEKAFGLERGSVLTFSAVSGEGRDGLIQQLRGIAQ
ncbi:MAG: ribosome biogenesis GTP-binding protein YihA/YsxC [Myxococcota bacterium]